MSVGLTVADLARDPLEVGEAAAAVENPAYVDSWKSPA